MLHHVDIHVRELAPVKALFDAIAETIRYHRLHDEPDFLSYEPADGGRPRIGFLPGAQSGGTMRLAFAVDSRERVDDAARLAVANGAGVMEGPSLNPEYGDDYYACFFDDPDGNKYEIVADPQAARIPRIARIWRSRVRPGMLRSYRRYIGNTGMNDYRKTPGNCGAWMLSATHEEHDDIITLSFWDSRPSVVRFAGEPIERAQYYPDDKKYLLDFPEKVEHFDID